MLRDLKKHPTICFNEKNVPCGLEPNKEYFVRYLDKSIEVCDKQSIILQKTRAMLIIVFILAVLWAFFSGDDMKDHPSLSQPPATSEEVYN